MMPGPQRTILKLRLEPILGSRFQPTGFPDLGAATFKRSGTDRDALIVESVQSMANRFEQTTWDEARNDQPEPLDGVPYVRIVDADRQFLTTSRHEAHRLAAAYVMDGRFDDDTDKTGEDWLQEQFKLVKGQPLDQQQVARVTMGLDPLSLVHGVFFARGRWPWQPKIARAVTCFIEAYDVQEANSGGVKRDSVSSAGGNADTGYGMVPHQRTEYTASSILALLSIDHDQLRSYGLGEAGVELLEALIEFEIASLFGGGLRLRTACDLAVGDVESGELPSVEGAEARLRRAVGGAESLLGPVRHVIWKERSAKAAKKPA